MTSFAQSAKRSFLVTSTRLQDISDATGLYLHAESGVLVVDASTTPLTKIISLVLRRENVGPSVE